MYTGSTALKLRQLRAGNLSRETTSGIGRRLRLDIFCVLIRHRVKPIDPELRHRTPREESLRQDAIAKEKLKKRPIDPELRHRTPREESLRQDAIAKEQLKKRSIIVLSFNLAQCGSMRDFPQELVDAVIESADLDTDCTWSRFSLVCRAWLPATRRHRFSYFGLKQVGSASYTYEAAKSRLFLQMLDDTESTFASFVTRLSIDGTSTKTREHPEVFRILSKLTALVSVEINVWSSELGIQPLQDWLSGLPHLTELTLNRTSFKFARVILALLESCSPLTALTVTTSSWESEYQLECSKIENRNARNRGLVIPL
ncbi:hypothetical protein B0H19DRAFT_1058903 [Mycena capillaripes]|nr:hypothetical protein B0H19DRAFT_1058903 [Mycena capillaripes]